MDIKEKIKNVLNEIDSRSKDVIFVVKYTKIDNMFYVFVTPVKGKSISVAKTVPLSAASNSMKSDKLETLKKKVIDSARISQKSGASFLDHNGFYDLHVWDSLLFDKTDISKYEKALKQYTIDVETFVAKER